ncbi:hypothetical protein F2981_01690 [Sinorhizobium meliloti]|nr:hypothetical protein [Sinorhizobium meliloti]
MRPRAACSAWRSRIAPEEMDRHIATTSAPRVLHAAFPNASMQALVLQRYSRLVIDCNRPWKRRTASCAERRDLVPVNARPVRSNVAAATWKSISRLHEAIAVALDRRQAAGKPLFLVSVHSFTPLMRATRRPDFNSASLQSRRPVSPNGWPKSSAPPIRRYRQAQRAVPRSTISPTTRSRARRAARHSACASSKCATISSTTPAATGMERTGCRPPPTCGRKHRRNQ